ncbi:MAG: prmC [Chitinophagaceae bacterium]|nr:prmC [Chitinophagaceae bacterium]
MTIGKVNSELSEVLQSIYDNREAANIASMVMEHITGLGKGERIIRKNEDLSAEQIQQFINIEHRLLEHEPVQYIIGTAWFMGLPFFVNNAVLIPRPETEELVEWIVEENRKSKTENRKLLDIGTGSGCIPVSIKKKLPGLNVSAIDLSTEALKVAGKNAQDLKTAIQLIQSDILSEDEWDQFGVYDIIVSNPPYIAKAESAGMQKNVLHHEPHLALFVENDDPLVFYRKIADFSKNHLPANGILYFEVSETLANDVADLLQKKGFKKIEIRKDLQGKDRMIKASY